MIRAAVLFTVIVATLWITLASFSTPFGWDSPAWALEARWWSEFDVAPYRDTVETKQPFLFIFLRFLLEHTAWALWPLRLSMMVLYAIGAAAFTIVAARYAPIGVAGVGALTWVWLSTHAVFVGRGWETDELVAILSVVAAALMHASPFGAGVAIALAASIKPTVLGVALFVWLGTRGHRWRVVAGGALTLIAVYGYVIYAIGWYPHAMLVFLTHGHADVGWWPRWELFCERFHEFFRPFAPFCVWALGGLMTREERR